MRSTICKPQMYYSKSINKNENIFCGLGVLSHLGCQLTMIQFSSNRKASGVKISNLNFDIQTVQCGPETAFLLEGPFGDATVLTENVITSICNLL